MRLFMCFTGVKQAGKSTAFSFIKDRYPEVQEVVLANKLKNVCSEVFGIPRDHFDLSSVKEKELDKLVSLDAENVSKIITQFGYTPDFEAHIRPHMCKVLHTPREIAQYIGTEVLRSLGEDVHCRGALRDIPETGIFVVTDVRFPNEYSFFKSLPDAEFYPHYICNYAAEVKAQADSHASEKHVLEIAKKCETIPNNGSLEELQASVLKAFETILLNRGVKLYDGKTNGIL